jgi:hypothetical protein
VEICSDFIIAKELDLVSFIIEVIIIEEAFEVIKAKEAFKEAFIMQVIIFKHYYLLCCLYCLEFSIHRLD